MLCCPSGPAEMKRTAHTISPTENVAQHMIFFPFC